MKRIQCGAWEIVIGSPHRNCSGCVSSVRTRVAYTDGERSEVNRKCSCSPCTMDQVACAEVRWGTDSQPTQTASLCEGHLNELWEKLNPLVAQNLAWITIDKPGALT